MDDMGKIMRPFIDNLMDAMAEDMGRKIANDIIRHTEECANDSEEFKKRKMLMYATIINQLESHVEKLMGDMKVT